jgi:NADPH:quinone reductase-like Zn-dependent oxidoreductase
MWAKARGAGHHVAVTSRDQSRFLATAGADITIAPKTAPTLPL